jgi:hypothetical protein
MSGLFRILFLNDLQKMLKKKENAWPSFLGATTISITTINITAFSIIISILIKMPQSAQKTLSIWRC